MTWGRKTAEEKMSVVVGCLAGIVILFFVILLAYGTYFTYNALATFAQEHSHAQ